jgi:hypothetical protein
VKKKFVDIVEMIAYEDLQKIKKDIEEGGFFVREIVNDRIKFEESRTNPECTVCSSSLSDDKNTFTIIFGKSSEKKKASFCALDCLEYFLKELKHMNKKEEITKKIAEEHL